jgi:hypothetical protein
MYIQASFRILMNFVIFCLPLVCKVVLRRRELPCAAVRDHRCRVYGRVDFSLRGGSNKDGRQGNHNCAGFVAVI